MLSEPEILFIAWYKTLNCFEQDAVDLFLETGDKELMFRFDLFATYPHVLTHVATP